MMAQPHNLKMYASLESGSRPTRCVILGGGAHAKVVVDTMLRNGEIPYGILDPDRARWNDFILGIRILGGDDYLPELVASGIEQFVVGVGSTGNTSVRRALFERGKRSGLVPRTLQHPTAICSTAAVIGEGAQLLAGSIIGPCASIGANAIINSGAIVEHDCVIESHAHVSPGVRLAGGVRVAEGAHIGIGATVRQGICIGARAIVGAGAVIVEDMPADVVVIGVPGRIYKRLAA